MGPSETPKARRTTRDPTVAASPGDSQPGPLDTHQSVIPAVECEPIASDEHDSVNSPPPDAPPRFMTDIFAKIHRILPVWTFTWHPWAYLRKSLVGTGHRLGDGWMIDQLCTVNVINSRESCSNRLMTWPMGGVTKSRVEEGLTIDQRAETAAKTSAEPLFIPSPMWLAEEISKLESRLMQLQRASSGVINKVDTTLSLSAPSPDVAENDAAKTMREMTALNCRLRFLSSQRKSRIGKRARRDASWGLSASTNYCSGPRV